MTPEEKIARIQNSFMNKGPSVDPEVMKILQEHTNEMKRGYSGAPVAPPRPDPEAAANAQINRAVNGDNSVVRDSEMRLAPNANQGDTSMARENALRKLAQPQVDPEELERQENERMMQMEYFARKAGLK